MEQIERLRRRGRWTLLTSLVVATLSVLLVACGGSAGGSPSSTAPSATDTPFGSNNTTPQAAITVTPLQGFPTAAPTNHAGGSSDVCQITPTPTPGDIPVPSDVPTYSGAQLIVHRKTQSNTQPPITIGEFDFCMLNASASPIATFYTDQLPKNGWQDVQTYSSGSISIVATKGPSNNQTTITVTVLQDLNPGYTNDVEIIISINNCTRAECG